MPKRPQLDAPGELDARRNGRLKVFDKVESFKRVLKLQESGLYPYFKTISGCDGTTVVIEGEPRINMGSNNYLGLTHHPQVLEAGKQAVNKFGSGCTGSRFLNGTLELHERLESALAELLGKEAVIVYPTGYQANVGLFSGLAGREDLVLMDKASHASIVDGARLSFSRSIRFDHGDLDQLEGLLQEHQGKGLMIAVDGVHSMDGDVADLPRFVELARRYGAALAVDDAHGIGVFGENGAGTPEHFGVQDGVHLIVGTFSKSLASIGGFVAGTSRVIHYLKHNSRPLMFSASLPPFSVGCVLEGLTIMVSEPERREGLWENTRRMVGGLRDLGFDLLASKTPIIPVSTGDDETTFHFWRGLLDEKVFTNPVVSPAVPPNAGRIRASLIAPHRPDQIDSAIDAFGKVGKRLGLV